MFCLSVISVTQSCTGFCLSLMTSCNNLLLNLSLWLQQKIESAQQIPTRHLIRSGWGQNMGTICTCHSPTRYTIKWPAPPSLSSSLPRPPSPLWQIVVSNVKWSKFCKFHHFERDNILSSHNFEFNVYLKLTTSLEGINYRGTQWIRSRFASSTTKNHFNKEEKPLFKSFFYPTYIYKLGLIINALINSKL